MGDNTHGREQLLVFAVVAFAAILTLLFVVASVAPALQAINQVLGG